MEKFVDQLPAPVANQLADTRATRSFTVVMTDFVTYVVANYRASDCTRKRTVKGDSRVVGKDATKYYCSFSRDNEAKKYRRFERRKKKDEQVSKRSGHGCDQTFDNRGKDQLTPDQLSAAQRESQRAPCAGNEAVNGEGCKRAANIIIPAREIPASSASI